MGINLRVPQNSVKVDGRNSSIYLAQQAIKGDDGGYYIPSLDSEGNLTWAPSEVEMPAVGGANIKGPKGDSGVWVGTETPDGDYNVWVKPDDEAIEIATKADLDGKQDKLIAGTNITIENNVISASGGGSDEVWVGSEEPTGDQTVWIDPTGSETAGLVTQTELANKQDKLTAGTNITIDANNVISASGGSGSYTLPVATTSTIGGVKPDGNTITIADDGTISSTASGLIGKSMTGFQQEQSEWGWIADWAQHPEKYYVVIHGTSETEKECPVVYTAVYNNQFHYCWFEGNTLHDRSITFTDNTLSQVQSVSQYSDGGTVWLTEQNWNNYITAGGDSWQVTTSTSESNLYGAKEVVIFWQDSNYNRHQSYLNVGFDSPYGNTGTWGTNGWLNTQITLDNNTQASITYDGSNVNTSNIASIDVILYKT